MNIFVDTGGWFSMVVTSDADHRVASDCFALFDEDTFITTDYVIDETLTLLRARGYDQRAQMLDNGFFGNTLATVHYLDEIQIRLPGMCFVYTKTRDGALPTAQAKLSWKN